MMNKHTRTPNTNKLHEKKSQNQMMREEKKYLHKTHSSSQINDGDND